MAPAERYSEMWERCNEWRRAAGRLSTGMGIARLTVGPNHALHARRLEHRAPRRAVPRALDDLSAVPLCRARRRRGRGGAVAASPPRPPRGRRAAAPGWCPGEPGATPGRPPAAAPDPARAPPP